MPCLCTTQVLEVDSEWKRDDCFCCCWCCFVDLHIQSHGFERQPSGYCWRLRCTHSFQQVIFLPKVCLYEGYENKSIFEHLSLIFPLFLGTISKRGRQHYPVFHCKHLQRRRHQDLCHHMCSSTKKNQNTSCVYFQQAEGPDLRQKAASLVYVKTRVQNGAGQRCLHLCRLTIRHFSKFCSRLRLFPTHSWNRCIH